MTYYAGFPGWGGPQAGMRASDADRERAVDVLKAGFAEGRLDRAEHDRRTEAVYRATTYGDLAAQVRDLPQGPLPLGPPPGYGPALPMVAVPNYLPVPPRPTDPMAVASLLCGLAGTVLGLPAPAAIVLGHAAKRRIRRSGDGGDSTATAGMVLGYLGLSLWLLVLVLAVGG